MLDTSRLSAKLRHVLEELEKITDEVEAELLNGDPPRSDFLTRKP